MSGYSMQIRGADRTHSPGAAASTERLTNFVFLQYATEHVWVRNSDSQPTKVILPILSPEQPRP